MKYYRSLFLGSFLLVGYFFPISWAGIYMGTASMAPLEYIPTPLPQWITINEDPLNMHRYPLETLRCEKEGFYSKYFHNKLDKWGDPIPQHPSF